MDEYRKLLGELGIVRSTLHKVLYMLPEDELDILLDQTSRSVAELKGLWGDRLSPLQEGAIDALERIEFFMRQREKLRPRNESGLQKPYFICRKCETSILIVEWADVICPACSTNRWLELVYA